MDRKSLVVCRADCPLVRVSLRGQAVGEASNIRVITRERRAQGPDRDEMGYLPLDDLAATMTRASLFPRRRERFVSSIGGRRRCCWTGRIHGNARRSGVLEK